MYIQVSDLTEVQGDSLTIAIDKCKRAAKILQGPVITEDTGLTLRAMASDLPGPYIKWFYTLLGSEKLSQMFLGYTGGQDPRALATCTVCFATGPDDDAIEVRTFEPIYAYIYLNDAVYYCL